MKTRAGALRPSQAVTQTGPGALADLPTLSMVIEGLDRWEIAKAKTIDEPRLAKGLKVDGFRRPPFYDRGTEAGGMPARVFPEYLVCPQISCGKLAHYSEFRFKSGRDPAFVCEEQHKNLKISPTVYPVRFMLACPSGHLDDFPWHYFVHQGQDQDCNAKLQFVDSGRTGSITDLGVQCSVHGYRNLASALSGRASKNLPPCSGRRPWLGPNNHEACKKSDQQRVLLRGASNAYFSVTTSSISIPPWSDPLHVVVGEYAEQLIKVTSKERLALWLEMTNAPDLDEFGVDKVWDALERRRAGHTSTTDLRLEEWHSFLDNKSKLHEASEFQVRRVDTPENLRESISAVVQAVRLREVRALRGFTRIDAVPDIGELLDVDAVDAGMSPLASEMPNWLPAVELRGEGIFLALNEERVQQWESSPAVQALYSKHASAQMDWYQARGQEVQDAKPARYLLIHSLAHLVIRRLGLECGYASASLRERIYCATGNSPMAGFLIYTAGSDSQGSLGGLVEMAQKEYFGPLISEGLNSIRICANDPLCADRDPSGTGTQLNGAACHACLLESETSCEMGNNFLDRTLLVGTLRQVGIEFFK